MTVKWIALTALDTPGLLAQLDAMPEFAAGTVQYFIIAPTLISAVVGVRVFTPNEKSATTPTTAAVLT